jgi:hypothetical protein
LVDGSVHDWTPRRLEEVRDGFVVVAIGGVVEVGGSRPESVVEVEGGLVLREAARDGVPVAGVVAGAESWAEDVDDCCGLFASDDPECGCG